MAIATGPFQGDSAYMGLQNILEWSDDSIEAVEQALRAITDAPEKEYFDVDPCAEAIVAAELVAGLLGHPSDQMPPHVRDWVDDFETLNDDRLETLRKLSIGATEVVMTSPNSEFRGLLEEGRQGGFTNMLEEWINLNHELLLRLGASEKRAQAIADKALEPLPPPNVTGE